MEDLPDNYKKLPAIEVLQKLERSGKFDYTYVADLLHILRSINRADLAIYVDEYRKRYSQPKRGVGSDPTSRGQLSRERIHRRIHSSSGLTLQEVAEIMHESAVDTSPGGSPVTLSSANSEASINVRIADFATLSLDGALEQHKKEGSRTPSPITFGRSSSGGSIGTVGNPVRVNHFEGLPLSRQLSPRPLPSNGGVTSPQSLRSYPGTSLAVFSAPKEWKVIRAKLNKSVYSHKCDATQLRPPIEIDLLPLGFRCHAKFHFILHPYGLDMDRGKNTTLEVALQLPHHTCSHNIDHTKIHLNVSAYDTDAQETINTMMIEGVLNQQKMLVFGFLPHLALKESHSRWIIVKGSVTATLTRETLDYT